MRKVVAYFIGGFLFLCTVFFSEQLASIVFFGIGGIALILEGVKEYKIIKRK